MAVGGGPHLACALPRQRPGALACAPSDAQLHLQARDGPSTLSALPLNVVEVKEFDWGIAVWGGVPGTIALITADVWLA